MIYIIINTNTCKYKQVHVFGMKEKSAVNKTLKLNFIYLTTIVK